MITPYLPVMSLLAAEPAYVRQEIPLSLEADATSPDWLLPCIFVVGASIHLYAVRTIAMLPLDTLFA